MNNSDLTAVLNWLAGLDTLGYLLILAAFFLETFAFIGLVFPGMVLILSLGFLTSKGVFSFWILALVIFLGSFAGDIASFYLGGKGGGFLQKKKWRFIFKKEYLERGKKFFARHGGKSVIISKFMGPVRPVVPFVAGLSRFPFAKFFPLSLASSLAWSLFYLFLGNFFGEAWQKVLTWSNLTGNILLGLVVGGFLGYVVFKRYREKKS